MELLVTLNSLLYNHTPNCCEDPQYLHFVIHRKKKHSKNGVVFRSCSFSRNQEISVDIAVLNKARAVVFSFCTFVCLRANKATHKQIFTDNIDV